LKEDSETENHSDISFQIVLSKDLRAGLTIRQTWAFEGLKNDIKVRKKRAYETQNEVSA